MDNILEIKNLYVSYQTFGGVARAINNLNLKIKPGESLGLVGETGAGKTTTALSILKLLPPRTGRINRGEIYFDGVDLVKKPEEYMQKIRGNKISMIFQNPLTSLNPVFTIGEQISMVFTRHHRLSQKEAWEKAGEMLEVVGIPSIRTEEYPHQFSGGMRQRVGIAAALACKPSLLIADEPTTALDVTIQAQVLELLKDLMKQYSTSLIMISHNLGVIADICQNVAVMYAGSIIEYGSIEQVFRHPSHPYTRGLFASLPDIYDKKERLNAMKGVVSDALNLPEGCKFNPRCPYCTEKCREDIPDLVQIGPDHYIACFKEKEMEGENVDYTAARA
jgi:peptide/nickel transport system ATP-binding protein